MEFSTNEMERKTGVKRLRLHNWIKDNLFIPSASSKIAGGHGIGNKYSQEDLYKIALLRKLLDHGIHGKTAASLLTLNMSNIRQLHQGEKGKGNPGLILCFGRRFANGKENAANVWMDVPGYRHDRGTQLSEKIISYFNDHDYDDVILINLSKLISEVDKS